MISVDIEKNMWHCNTMTIIIEDVSLFMIWHNQIIIIIIWFYLMQCNIVKVKSKNLKLYVKEYLKYEM
jgi:hypothetical protein